MIVVQLSDVLQYVCGKLFGKHKIAPNLSPSKTVEGFVGGILLSSLIGAALWWTTPFNPWQSFLIALLINLLGFAGGIVMSAIKRDRGVKDWGRIDRGPRRRCWIGWIRCASPRRFLPPGALLVDLTDQLSAQWSAKCGRGLLPMAVCHSLKMLTDPPSWDAAESRRTPEGHGQPHGQPLAGMHGRSLSL